MWPPPPIRPPIQLIAPQPVLTVPAEGLVLPSLPGTGTTFELHWIQPGAPLANGVPLAPARYFVICLLTAPIQQCAWPGTYSGAQAPAVISNPPIGSVPSVLLWPRTSQFDASYHYWSEHTMPFSSSARALRWVIGACSAPRQSGCSFASPRQLALSPHDLRLSRFAENTGIGSSLTFDAFVTNEGYVPSGAYTVTLRAWRVLVRTGVPSGECHVRTDYTADDVPPDAKVLTVNGEAIDRSEEVPAFERIGIWWPGPETGELPIWSDSDTRTSQSLAVGAQMAAAHVDLAQSALNERPTGYIVWARVALASGEPDFDALDNVSNRFYCRR